MTIEDQEHIGFNVIYKLRLILKSIGFEVILKIGRIYGYLGFLRET